jgi:PGF-pre-PGF domain-containing protein
MVSTTEPTFDWSGATGLSGVTYELVISSDPDFNSIVLRKTGLNNNTYTLSSTESLPTDAYWWRVRAVNNAGLPSDWTSARALVISSTSPATVQTSYIPANEPATADLSAYGRLITKVIMTLNRSASDVQIQLGEYNGAEFTRTFEWAPQLSGSVYTYFAMVAPNVDLSSISSSVVGFKVTKSWVAENGIDSSSVRLFRLLHGEWNEMPTTLKGDDENYLYFESTMDGFSATAFGVSTKEESNVVILPVMPPMIIFALLSMFGVIGGGLGYFVYIRKIRPIPQVVSLRRLIRVSRPAAEIPIAIVPSVRLEMLKPAPVTQAPGVPTEPVEPVPITIRPVIPPVAPTSKTLTILQRVGPARVPGILKITGPAPISLPQLVRVARPVAPISLAQLAKVARPVSPTTQLGDLAKVAREAPAIEMKRLEATVRPVEPAVMLEKLKKTIDARDKTAALEQLKKKDLEKRTDGGTPARKRRRRRRAKRI